MKETMDGTYKRFKWLVFGYIMATAISAFATILLARIMGPAVYGTYAASIVLPFIFVGLVDLGIGSAVTYYISKSKVDRDIISVYFKTAVSFVLFFVGILAVALSVSSSFIARYVFNRAELAPYIRVSSFIVLYMAIGSICNGALLSIYKQRSVGIFYIANSIVRNTLAVYLFIKTHDVFYAVIGQTLGFLSVSTIYLLYALRIFRNGRVSRKVLRSMLSYGLPYGLGMFIVTICIQFYNVVAVRLLAAEMYGNFSAAWLILSGVMVIPTSFMQSLFPSFSETNVGLDVEPSAAFSSAVKVASSMFLYLWVTFGGLAEVIVSLVYGPKYMYADEIFTLLSSVFLLSILGWGIINPLLLSIKKTKALAAINITAVAISIIVIGILTETHLLDDFLIIPIAFFTLHAVATIGGYIYLRRKYGVGISLKALIKTIAVVFILFKMIKYLSGIKVDICIRVLEMEIHLGPVIKLLVGFLGFGILYIVLLILSRVLTREDYEILKTTVFSFPILRRILGIITEPTFDMSDRLNGFLYKLNKSVREKISSKIAR